MKIFDYFFKRKNQMSTISKEQILEELGVSLRLLEGQEHTVQRYYQPIQEKIAIAKGNIRDSIELLKGVLDPEHDARFEVTIRCAICGGAVMHEQQVDKKRKDQLMAMAQDVRCKGEHKDPSGILNLRSEVTQIKVK